MRLSRRRAETIKKNKKHGGGRKDIENWGRRGDFILIYGLPALGQRGV